MDNVFPAHPQVPEMINPPNKPIGLAIYIPVLLIAMLLVFGVGFFTGKIYGVPKTSTAPAPTLPTNNNPLVDSVPTTIIRGEITKVNGKVLSVTNINGVSGEIQASDKIAISKPGGGDAISSLDLNSIELNKEAVLSIAVNAGSFEVVSIIYPPSPVPPSSTPSGQLKNTR